MSSTRRGEPASRRSQHAFLWQGVPSVDLTWQWKFNFHYVCVWYLIHNTQGDYIYIYYYNYLYIYLLLLFIIIIYYY